MTKKVIINADLKHTELKGEVDFDVIESEVNQLMSGHMGHKNLDVASKILLNSQYGVIGFVKFILYDRRVAETVTTSSQATIKFTIKVIDDYFKYHFKKDKKLHKIIGFDGVAIDFGNVVNYADSVAGDSIVKIRKNGVESSVPISSLFTQTDDFTDGKQRDYSVDCDALTVIVDKNGITRHKAYRPVQYVMKHTTDKQMYRISAGDRYVDVTEDNSLIQALQDRDTGVRFEEIKPGDISENTKAVIDVGLGIYGVDYQNVKVKKLGIRKQEVYDIEVADTHTFFANDILVHNTDSVFVVVSKVFTLSQYNSEDPKNIDIEFRTKYMLPEHVPHGSFLERIEFYLKLHDYGMKPYLKHMFKKYIDLHNGFHTHISGQDTLRLGLENICDAILWVGKKMYVKSIMWDDGKIKEPLSNIKATGLNINKATTPKFIRDNLQMMVKEILARGKKVDMSWLSETLIKIKSEFELKDISDICFTMKVNNYRKYVLKDDKELELLPGTGEHVRAAATYNHRLLNSKYRGIYPLITSGTRIQYYITKNPEIEVFGFPNARFTPEIAPNIDYDRQFAKVFLGPLNNMLAPLGVSKIHADLILTPSLW